MCIAGSMRVYERIFAAAAVDYYYETGSIVLWKRPWLMLYARLLSFATVLVAYLLNGLPIVSTRISKNLRRKN